MFSVSRFFKVFLTPLALLAFVAWSKSTVVRTAPGTGADQNSSPFLIAPYIFSTDSGELKVAWQYQPASTFANPGLQILVDQGAGTDGAQVPATADGDLWVSNLAQKACGFGTLRYQVPGMTEAKNVTAIPCQEDGGNIRLAFIADAQEGPQFVQTLAQQMQQQSVTAILNDGDLVETGDKMQDWVDYFGAMSALSSNIVMFPAVGNHEYRAQPNSLLWSHFFQKPAEQAHYSFFLGDAHIIVLNTCFTDDPAQTDSQLPWLREQLAVQAQWKIVMFHHAVYSKGFFNSPLSPKKEYQDLQREYVPLFESAGVDLVLNGHTHIYEHSVHNNIHYLVAGPAGGLMGFYATSNPYSVFSALERTVTYFDVSSHQILAKTLNIEGQQIDTFTLAK